MTGRFNGQFKTYAICGAIRRMVSAPDLAPQGPLRGMGVRFSCLFISLSPCVASNDLSMSDWVVLAVSPYLGGWKRGACRPQNRATLFWTVWWPSPWSVHYYHNPPPHTPPPGLHGHTTRGHATGSLSTASVVSFSWDGSAVPGDTVPMCFFLGRVR